jgi:hypothetical protein
MINSLGEPLTDDELRPTHRHPDVRRSGDRSERSNRTMIKSNRWRHVDCVELSLAIGSALTSHLPRQQCCICRTISTKQSGSKHLGSSLGYRSQDNSADHCHAHNADHRSGKIAAITGAGNSEGQQGSKGGTVQHNHPGHLIPTPRGEHLATPRRYGGQPPSDVQRRGTLWPAWLPGRRPVVDGRPRSAAPEGAERCCRFARCSTVHG